MDPTYQVRPAARQYGVPLGIVTLDFSSPFVPGDVGNASTFPYPVVYRRVPGLSVRAILADDDGRFATQVVEAAHGLVESGVGAVTSNCGFMLRYQVDVARAVSPAPVVMSSLLQLPMIAASLAPEQSVGIVTADSRTLTDRFVTSLLGPLPCGLSIIGLEDAPRFASTMFDGGKTLDVEAIGAEVERAVSRLRESDPDLGAVLLECAALPAYAFRVQEAAGGLPVYDFTTMTDWLHSARYRRRFGGYY